MKRIFQLLGLVLLALAAVIVVRAANLPTRQIVTSPAQLISVDPEAESRRLSGAVQFRTVSYEQPQEFPAEEFRRLQSYLEAQFPVVHQRLTREAVGEFSSLYTWNGSDPKLPAAVLMGHIDTVPIVPDTEVRWQYPPFSGEIRDGFIWGRGTMDDKFAVVGILSAVESLLKAGFQPTRTVYLVFGHDEELGGPRGAEQIAKLLESRKVQADFVLDEGGAIVEGAVPGFERPVATIGIAEKGSISLELEVKTEGGHSSTPPEHTAIGILSAGIEKLENKQMPKGLRGAAGSFMQYVAPELPFSYRLALGNLWLFEPVIGAALGASPAVNATLRTTTAVTMIHGGVKANVLPTDARATVNFRTLPGDTSDVVTEHVRRVIDDPRIQIRVSEDARDASPISPTDSEAFTRLQTTIGQVFPNVVVAPFLTLGGTDSRHFTGIGRNVYRFSPLFATQEDLARVHGTNERIGVDNFARAIQFYAHLIQQL